MAGSRRSWGWHALRPHWAELVVTDAGVPDGALVFDLGAGDGALCAPLLETGAHVVAVELNPRRAERLRRRFGTDLRVVESDLRDLRLPRRPFHVVANPPYGVSSDLLRVLLAPGSRLVRGHLVLQDQAVRRWAGPGAPGRRRWAARFELRAGLRLPAKAFRPPPAVQSRVLIVERRGRHAFGYGRPNT